MKVIVLVPIRTAPGQNVREHHRVRARRVKAERDAVSWCLACMPKPALPVRIHLVRVSPSARGLDAHDNLPAALKAPVDQVAAWLGIEDRDPRVQWTYGQRQGPWAVEIVWGDEC